MFNLLHKASSTAINLVKNLVVPYDYDVDGKVLL